MIKLTYNTLELIDSGDFRLLESIFHSKGIMKITATDTNTESSTPVINPENTYSSSDYGKIKSLSLHFDFHQLLGIIFPQFSISECRQLLTLLRFYSDIFTKPNRKVDNKITDIFFIDKRIEFSNSHFIISITPKCVFINQRQVFFIKSKFKELSFDKIYFEILKKLGKSLRDYNESPKRRLSYGIVNDVMNESVKDYTTRKTKNRFMKDESHVDFIKRISSVDFTHDEWWKPSSMKMNVSHTNTYCAFSLNTLMAVNQLVDSVYEQPYSSYIKSLFSLFSFYTYLFNDKKMASRIYVSRRNLDKVTRSDIFNNQNFMTIEIGEFKIELKRECHISRTEKTYQRYWVSNQDDPIKMYEQAFSHVTKLIELKFGIHRSSICNDSIKVYEMMKF